MLGGERRRERGGQEGHERRAYTLQRPLSAPDLQCAHDELMQRIRGAALQLEGECKSASHLAGSQKAAESLPCRWPRKGLVFFAVVSDVYALEERSV